MTRNHVRTLAWRRAVLASLPAILLSGCVSAITTPLPASGALRAAGGAACAQAIARAHAALATAGATPEAHAAHAAAIQEYHTCLGSEVVVP